MNSINNKAPLDENIGGVSALLFMPMPFIISMFVLENGMYDLDQFAYTGVDVAWFKVEFIKETARFTQEQATGPNGNYIKQKVEFKIAKDYASRFAVFSEMQEYEFGVVIVNSNNLPLLVGTININGDKSGMRFIANSDTGLKYTDRNEISCMFYAESSKRAAPAMFETAPPVEEPPIDTGGGWQWALIIADIT